MPPVLPDGCLKSFLLKNMGIPFHFNCRICSDVSFGNLYFYFVSNYVIHVPVSWKLVLINCFFPYGCRRLSFMYSGFHHSQTASYPEKKDTFQLTDIQIGKYFFTAVFLFCGRWFFQTLALVPLIYISFMQKAHFDYSHQLVSEVLIFYIFYMFLFHIFCSEIFPLQSLHHILSPRTSCTRRLSPNLFSNSSGDTFSLFFVMIRFFFSSCQEYKTLFIHIPQIPCLQPAI